MADPQRWNKYTYALNDPLKYTDPDGAEPEIAQRRDDLALLAGTITAQEYRARQNARGLGALVGVAGAAGAAGGPEAVGWLNGLFAWALGHATEIQQAGDAIADMLSPPGSPNTIRVIGHYPEYVETAEQLGAKYFSIPEKIWNRMSADQQWAANQKFLDRAIERGATFVLATGRDAIRKGSPLAHEVEYLLAHGYKWSKDGTQLIESK